MKAYKRSSGLVTMRSGNGRFRKTTMEDIGIYNANKEATVYICNICEKEFTPIVHSGVCFYCGVDNKRVKVINISPEKQVVLDKIKAIRNKQFINRFDLSEIQKLEIELKQTK